MLFFRHEPFPAEFLRRAESDARAVTVFVFYRGDVFLPVPERKIGIKRNAFPQGKRRKLRLFLTFAKKGKIESFPSVRFPGEHDVSGGDPERSFRAVDPEIVNSRHNLVSHFPQNASTGETPVNLLLPSSFSINAFKISVVPP